MTKITKESVQSEEENLGPDESIFAELPRFYLPNPVKQYVQFHTFGTLLIGQFNFDKPKTKEH